MSVHDRIEQLWWTKAAPPLWLRCIEPVYAAISAMHLRRRAARAMPAPLPLISVGNISAGGSGKTPFVLWLADALQSKGYEPVILCRGDGGKATNARIIQPQDRAAEIGDEARMLADLSACPVIVAHDRCAGSQLANGLGNLIILDDGFQYRHLQRCCDIVLIPADGLGNGHQIPAGPLREPITSLQRATMIVRTGNAADMETCEALSANTEYHWIREAGALRDATGSCEIAPQRVHAVTAIARPQRFFNDLQDQGIKLDGHQSFPDHYAFTPVDIQQLTDLHTDIAVTAKDAVKLLPLWPEHRPLWLLPLQGHAEPAMLSNLIRHLP